MSAPNVWTRPVSADFKFDFRIGESVLVEFARAHEPAAILRELIQNEYDAGGSLLQVSFGEEGLTIKGNGEPVDRMGWRRLSVMMGTGRIAGTSERVRPKVNGIGEKNFGLRSLFVFGDELYIRSNGLQTILHRERGSLPRPIPDPASANTRGIEIFVPYRTKKVGRLDPFTYDAEAKGFENLAQAISPALLKLADLSAPKSLRGVVVSSSRLRRRIEWKQSVRHLKAAARGVTLLSRRVQMVDSKSGVDQIIEEHEWQRNFRLSPEFDLASIPGYFRRSSRSIRLGISLRTNRGRLHPDLPPGIVYYPIGVSGAYTGNAVSLNAPFDMDFDRRLLNDPTNSSINAWLLDNLAQMTIDVLKEDWFERFGANAYLAVGKIHEASVPVYAEALENRLRSTPVWPTRLSPGAKSRALEFAPATELNIPTNPRLDGFLSDARRYLHPRLIDDSVTADLALKYGAKRFSLNSLVRLFCCGKDTKDLKTKISEGESNYWYTSYPDALKGIEPQVKFLRCLDAHWSQLSSANRSDLESYLLMSAAGELRSAKHLRCVPAEIQDVCPLPARDRLHPELLPFVRKRRLCKKFNSNEWVRDVAARVRTGLVTDDERMALYGFILAVNGRFPSAIRAALRKAPVLRDHRNQWVSPSDITLAEALGARDIKAALHLPHPEFARNIDIAKALRFKRTITGEDLIAYAGLVAEDPSLAPACEETLSRFKRLLTRKVVAQLREIAFLISSDCSICTPKNLYLSNSVNLACVGPDAPYAGGKRTHLYRLLGCKERPDVDGILKYLSNLSEAEMPPPHPERLYPELVRALQREDKSPTALKEEEILWTNVGYSSPAETLVGNSWTKVFASYVPCASDLIPAVRDAYLALGASMKPQLHHWTRILISIGKEHLSTAKPLSGQRRNSIREAYRGMKAPPSIPEHIPWLLDRDGRLHSTAAALSSNFLIDDEPTLSDALREVSADIGFADAAEPSLLAFFNMAGIKSLADVRQRVGQTIGSRRAAPPWFDETKALDGLTKHTFLDAVETIVLHNFGTLAGAREHFQAATRRLRYVRRIEFVETLTARYRVGDSTVSVPVRAACKNGVVYLTFVRSRSEMNGLLASLVAEEYLDRVSDQRSLADGVYRLLTSDSDRDLRGYLHSRGIRQKSRYVANQDDEMDQAIDEQEQDAEAIHSALVRSFETAMEQSRRPTDPETPVPNPSAGGTNGNDLPETTPLPPIEDVKPVISDPTPGWSYRERSKIRTSGGWTRPPTGRTLEWDREVGRRGEEIILQIERSRVRNLGLLEDRVRWIAKEFAAADFDILSVDNDGEELTIEVKSTTGADGRFHWSRAEFQRALRDRERYVLYRVYRATSCAPVVRAFRDPIAKLASGILRLDIEVFHGELEPL